MPARRSRFRVTIADGQPVYREGLVRAIKLRPDLELVGESGDGRRALTTIRTLRPDVAVLDMRMPGLDAAQVLNAIGREGLGTRVLVLSADEDNAAAYRIAGAGAGGYLLKDASSQAICDAMVAVARGASVISPQATAALFSEIRLRERGSRPALTRRQQEVLQLTARGRSAVDIGTGLHVSPETVRTHLAHLYEKLGVSDRAAAVAEAMRRGLIE